MGSSSKNVQNIMSRFGLTSALLTTQERNALYESLLSVSHDKMIQQRANMNTLVEPEQLVQTEYLKLITQQNLLIIKLLGEIVGKL